MTATEELLSLLTKVRDPEIPALSIIDMAIVRNVGVDGKKVTVTITPTYSGCPAMHLIEQEIKDVLTKAGYTAVHIETKLSPAWSTDWLSDEAKEKLRSSGIAPPGPVVEQLVSLKPSGHKVCCPYCCSTETAARSEFGSTPCKALYFCNSCQQPFEYFKPL